MHHAATTRSDIGGATGQLAGLPCVGRGALHGLGQALHRNSGLLQRGGLLFGALRQIAVALRDFGGTDRNGVGSELDLANDGGHRLDQRVHALAQLRDRALLVGHGDAPGQIALFGSRHHFPGLRHRALHGLVLMHLRGDVGRVLDDLERLPVEVEDGVVGGLDPYLAPPLAQATILAGIVFAAPEFLPEAAVLITAAMARLDEQ